MDKINAFIKEAGAYGIKLTEKQAELNLAYMHEILLINTQINLTAIREEPEFIEKHLIDSLMCDLDHLKSGDAVLDIGTGGGFPGIPLAIKYPEIHFMLMDSTGKKLKVVETIAQKLKINNVTILEGRAEEKAKDKVYREHYDAVVSRGVADLAVLCELSLPFVREKGTFFAWKGKNAEAEINGAENALKTLNSKIKDRKAYKLMKTAEKHVIIAVEKMKKTPEKYPRNYGVIKKRPL